MWSVKIFAISRDVSDCVGSLNKSNNFVLISPVILSPSLLTVESNTPNPSSVPSPLISQFSLTTGLCRGIGLPLESKISLPLFSPSVSVS